MESLAATIDGRKAFELLATLPDEYREVIVLRFVDELGPKEISQLVEESENVVSVRLHRGLKMLRSAMEREEKIREEGRHTPQKPPKTALRGFHLYRLFFLGSPCGNHYNQRRPKSRFLTGI